MKRTLMLLAALAALTPLAAHAQERLSDSQYIAASRCLAYSDLPQLQSDQENFTALRQASQGGFRSDFVQSQVRDDARRVRVTARRLANAERGMEELRQQRDDACAAFVERGLVQFGAATPSS